MRDQHVDMVGAQTFQARLQLGSHGLRAEIAMNGLAVLLDEGTAARIVPDEAAFGHQHNLVAPACDGAADDLLCPAEPIGRGGVDQRHACVE